MPQITPPAPTTQKLTQHQKIIAMMCQNPEKKWWLPTDFMQGGDFFVGYEASARLSELQNDYPDMFETRQSGRFKERRIMFETGNDWFSDLPKDIKQVIRTFYKK